MKVWRLRYIADRVGEAMNERPLPRFFSLEAACRDCPKSGRTALTEPIAERWVRK